MVLIGLVAFTLALLLGRNHLVVSKKNEKIKTLPLYAAEDLKKVNFFKSLITSINYLIWGDV